jgi:hypothetical protein
VVHVARMGEMRNSYKISVGLLERPGRRWEHNTGMNLKTNMVLALVNTVTKFRVP